MRNREGKKKTLKGEYLQTCFFKSRIKRQKALLQREDAKHLEMLYLFWAECKLSSSLPSLLITSDIEFSKYSLLIIDGFFYTQDKRLSGTVWELFQKKIPRISLYLQDVSLGYSGRKFGCPDAASRKISTYSIYFPRLVFVIFCGHLIGQVIFHEGFKCLEKSR